MSLPAPAILASTLLQKCRHAHDGLIDTLKERHQDGSNWDLMKDIDLGVSFSSPQSTVFSCGRVVGISGLNSVSDQTQGNDGGDVRGWVGEVR